MKKKGQEQFSAVLNALQDISDKIRALEAEARKALLESNDIAVYKRKLNEKTLLLVDLSEALEPLLEGLESKTAEEIRTKAANLAKRAEPALSLSSTFYMSALLYPEDYQEGDKNDLEKFIEQLQAKYQHSDANGQ